MSALGQKGFLGIIQKHSWEYLYEFAKLGIVDSVASEEEDDRIGPFWGYQVNLLGSGESRLWGQPT